MIQKAFRAIKYKINPPKVGDIYYGDTLYFIVGRPIEHVLHGLLDKNGRPIVEIVPSDDCYRLIIESANVPAYYKCASQVFCTTKDSFKWMERTQPSRIDKKCFRQMVIDGLLKKGNKV